MLSSIRMQHLKIPKKRLPNFFQLILTYFLVSMFVSTIKSFTSRLRYIVQPTRELWAAWIAKKLENSGILTPKVYAIGQRKNLGIISDTYIITEALLDAQSVQDILRTTK